MRLTIQRRLFLATFVLALAMTALLLLLVRWNLEQGFGRYTASAEMARLDWLADRLEGAYAEHGNWEFLRGDASVWRRLCRPPASRREGSRDEPPPDDRPSRARPGEPGPQRGPRRPADERVDAAESSDPTRPDDLNPRRDEPPEGAGAASPPPNDPLDLGPRIGLLDDTGRLVVGNGAHVPAAERALVVGGRPVGRLTLQPSVTAASALDRAFLASQRHNLLLSGLLALVLSVFAAWTLSLGLLRPVRDLAAGAREIAQGRLDARIPVRQNDELGALASDFNDMAARLARADEARRAWLADASHELRTPLAVLQAEIEAMQDGVRPADPQSLASLHRQVLKLAKLVADLRLTLDRREIEKDMLVESVDPVAELALVIEEFRPRFAEAGIALETTSLAPAQATTPGAGPTPAAGSGRSESRLVRGDGDRLRQVLMNLLENSLRYTNRGGRLRVTHSLRKGWMTLQFDDTEPAPPRSALPHLFERFYRAEPSRNRARGGSGLGLSICKAVVEAHGGRVSARLSELGGLCVCVELPLEGTKR